MRFYEFLARLDKKGRITVPKLIREKLALREGSVARVKIAKEELEGGRK